MAEKFVKCFDNHYKNLRKNNILKGRTFKIPYTGSVQTNLSVFKKKVIEQKLAGDIFINALHLSKEEHEKLQKARESSMRAKSIDIEEVDGEAVVIDSIALLESPNSTPVEKCIALACLSGRRTAEIIFSMTFNEPEEKHHTNLCYWTRIKGVLKQRDQKDMMEREIPLFISRPKFLKALAEVREAMPSDSVKDVNKKYAKQISRTMQRIAPNIGHIHTMRKLYGLLVYKYFNDRNCSQARVVSDVLGHRKMSESVLTYLSFKLKDQGKILNYH
jgi:hypothetical protein